MCIKITTQNDFIYGELGRSDMYSHRLTSIVKYWLKILKCADRKYTRVMYNVLLQDFENNPRCINWVSMLRNMLCNFGFNDVWLAQGVANINIFVSVFKQRVKDTFIQSWYSRID